MDKFQFDINQFFRYLLSGAWAIACYFFMNQDQIENIQKQKDSWLIISGLAMVIGFTVHAIYRAIFYPLWYKFIYARLENNITGR